MSQEPFGYWAIYGKAGRTSPATGLICNEYSRGPFRAVIWDHFERRWAFNPRAAAPFLFDFEKMDRSTKISRAEAEKLALETFGVPLPSEEELHRICEEGDQAEKASR
jgi:hypothetical protein